MVIDDDDVFQEVVRRACRKIPEVREVSTADNGAEALVAIKGWLSRGDPVPDVMFVDINMPVLDGFGFLERFRELRKLHPELEAVNPIAMLSSSDQERDKVQALELGANEYLVKGIGMASIRGAIAECIA